MTRVAVLPIILSLAILAPSAAAQEWAQKMFKVTEHDFGAVARDARAEFAFELENPYMEEVRIARVHTTCGCTTPRIEKDSLKTYETGAIVARVNTDRFLGRKGATITVTFDRPYHAQVQLRVSVFICSDVVFDPCSAQLGSVDQGSRAEARVRVQHTARSDWRIEEVKNANPHLRVEVFEAERRVGRVVYDLVVSIDGGAPPGYIRDHLMLATNDGNRPQVPLLVEGRVVSGVAVSPASLFMGVVEPGQKVTRQLVVRGKHPLRILSIDCDDPSFQFDLSDPDTPRTVHLVPVTFTASDARGKVSRTIRIRTDSGTAGVPQLPAYAVVTPDAAR